MKDYISVKVYIWTFIFRAIWSLGLIGISIAGFAVIATNDLQHS